MSESLVKGKDMVEADHNHDLDIESETKTLASNVARQILLISRSESSADAYKAAVTYLESIKAGEVGVLSELSFLLVEKEWPLEVRLYASKMLQDLVRLRWDEMSPTEHMDISGASFELMSEVANPCEECAMKSETVALVAEIFERDDPKMWQELFLSLVSLSSRGPLQAELTLWVVERLSEHHSKELEDKKHRHLLQRLPDILVWLHDLLEEHFGAARNAEGRQKVELENQHSAAVVACLNAINSFTEWAPVLDLVEYRIVDQCKSLLSTTDFCHLACMFFKVICSRKRPTDASGAEFDSAISHVFPILTSFSGELLCRLKSSSGDINGSEYDFAERICKIMVSLGSTGLQCIFTDNSAIALYLKQMLGFFQHYKFGLHVESLFFWLALMEYLISDPMAPKPSRKGSTSEIDNSSGHLDDGRRMLLRLIDDDIASTILDVSFQRLNKNEEAPPGTNLSLEPSKYKDVEFCKYQQRLFGLIKLISSHKPIIASTKVSSTTIMLIKNISVPSAPLQYAAAMKSQSTALESILRRLFCGSNEFAGGNSEVHSQLHVIYEDLLQELLYVKWTEPVLIQAHGDYLNAMIPFLKYLPDAVGSVIDKLFALLTSLPPTFKAARLNICSSLMRVAKAADKSFIPHLKGLADRMTRLQREGTLLPGEHSSLVEAFFAMTSASGAQGQQDSSTLLIEQVRQQWTEAEWQKEYISSPSGFVRLCSNPPLMRFVVNTVMVFENALKGYRFKKRKLNRISEMNHPLACHLSWILPPLKVFRVINSLSSPAVYQTLPPNLKAAMKILQVELQSLQGFRNRKPAKGLFTYSSEGSSSDIQKWLKAFRDSGYRVLQLSVTIGDTFYTSIDANYVAVALTENIWWMEFRHIKQLINALVIYLVKSCPADKWESWLEMLLSPLLTHCQRALSSSWTSFLRDGRANVPDLLSFEGGKNIKPKLEEKLIIGLTRAVADLLSKMSAPELNTGLPDLNHSDRLVHGEMSLLKDFDALRSSCLVSFLLSCRNLAQPVLQFCLQACTWTDGVITITSLRSFLISVIHLAIMTNNGELGEYVSKDLFYALIMSLTIGENLKNSSVISILVGLCHEIFVHLSERHQAPRQVLLSFPRLSLDDLHAYEKALAETSETKRQKQLTRSLLSLAIGISLEYTN
ncbi:unnamed protein product [Microthlaspi erraticum]|uniref:Importin N-terminal domain-containing protein n=1 Tax=Microthlaspi erraticum TaxID=1685480 RepID=A0A6D2JPA6_9BRAS|nr:unnamed protein product [Microthlaspi erraticum]